MKLFYLLTVTMLFGCAATPDRGQNSRVADEQPPCRAGNLDGCEELAEQAKTRALAGTLPTTEPTQLDWKIKACEFGGLRACNWVGWAYHKGQDGAPHDEVKATDFFKRSCPSDDVYDDYGCGNLGYQFEMGLGAPKDYPLAAKYYAMSCNRDMEASCYSLGIAYERGRGIAQDQARARELYEFSCKKGHGSACTNIGVMLMNGEGGPVDGPRAIKLLTQECDANDGYACGSLGYAYDNGLFVSKDACKALSLFEKSCNANRNPVGCGNWGSTLAAGSCGQPDLDRAVPLLVESCESSYSHGCGSLGRLYQQGLGVAKDVAKGIGYLERGCKKGESYSCLRLGDVYRKGAGKPKDEAMAFKFYTRSCESGRATACVAAAKLEQDPTKKASLLDRACRLDNTKCGR